MVRKVQLGAVATVVMVLAVTMISCFCTLNSDTVYTEGRITGKNSFGDSTISLTKSDILDAGFSVYDTIDVTVRGITYHAVITDTYAVLGIGSVFIYIGSAEDDTSLGMEFIDTNWEDGDVFTVERTGHEDLKAEYPKICQSKRTREQCGSDEEFANYREVTLGSISPGILYRFSTPLKGNGDQRSATVNELCKRDEVDYLIGLNMSAETVDNLIETGALDGTYYKTVYESGKVTNMLMSTNMFTDKIAGGILRAIINNVDNDTVFGISCTIGQDRTGFIIMLIGILMGAGYDDLCDDFMLSFCNYYGVEKGTKEYDLTCKNRFDTMLIGIHCYDDLKNYRQVDWGQDVSSFDIRSDAITFVKAQYDLTDSEINSLINRLSS